MGREPGLAEPLAESFVESFVEHGFVRLEAAFPRELARECRALLWADAGCAPDDPRTWTRPLIRLPSRTDAPFRRAAGTPALHAAFDRLVGPGRWVPRQGLGTFPLRFPHADDPGDTGWHVEGGFRPPGSVWPWVDVRSRGRALLMFFLFSDVGPDDAPTLLRPGSHRDVAALLAPQGPEGMSTVSLRRAWDRRDDGRRPVVAATGRAGDVYLCHPFLVHSAQRHRGRTPRFLAQPCLAPRGPLEEGRPVAEAIRRAVP
ncbi:phytanoyl-CoA dioxygenase family protein [Streptomyces tritici]|uniref:phytanoyl-CoA dioxygenase family protein n=1 Tax=Streptomyces tritici TaxID=2054410 RepID=UPI003AF0A398